MGGHDVGWEKEESSIAILIFCSGPHPATFRGYFDLAPESKIKWDLEFRMEHNRRGLKKPAQAVCWKALRIPRKGRQIDLFPAQTNYAIWRM
jgi:hypothetical protein